MQLNIKELVVELTIDAPKDHVYNVMVNRLTDWWPRDFLGLPDAEKIQFEPWAGGRLFESTPDGRSLLWGTVVAVTPGSSLEVVGHMTSSYGGPSVTMWKLSVAEAEDGKTAFRMNDSIIGHFPPETEENMNQGWNYLFGALKEFCEKSVPATA